jgi:endogenous inhibitor of DNA gyrase (YacG/DUF329 family)
VNPCAGWYVHEREDGMLSVECSVCGGPWTDDHSCFSAFHPYTCGRCREALGPVAAPEFATQPEYAAHVLLEHPEGDIP